MSVISGLMELTGDAGRLVAHSDVPWRSPTFDGHRHVVTLRFDGNDAVVTGEALLAELAGLQQLTFGDELVADATLKWTRRQISPEAMLVYQLELLTVREDRTLAA